MQTNESRAAHEMITYDLGTSTETIAGKREPEVLDQKKIEETYGLAKPRRRFIKAKIVSE